MVYSLKYAYWLVSLCAHLFYHVFASLIPMFTQSGFSLAPVSPSIVFSLLQSCSFFCSFRHIFFDFVVMWVFAETFFLKFWCNCHICYIWYLSSFLCNGCLGVSFLFHTSFLKCLFQHVGCTTHNGGMAYGLCHMFCSYLGGLVFLMYRLPFVECMMFGALISATDPVTVLSIFQVIYHFFCIIIHPFIYLPCQSTHTLIFRLPRLQLIILINQYTCLKHRMWRVNA